MDSEMYVYVSRALRDIVEYLGIDSHYAENAALEGYIERAIKQSVQHVKEQGMLYKND